MPRFAPHPDRRPAIVTGASSGIGQAVAITLAAAGHPVVLGARRVDTCEVTAANLRGAGAEAIAVRLDLTDAESISAFATAAEAAFGPTEVLVSNAGEVLPTLAHETDPATFATQVQVNLLGAQQLVSHVVPGMVGRGRGDVVFVTSDVVRSPRPRMASYVTAKWGLEGMARAMQMELEGTGVRVGIVRPGPTTSGQGSTWGPDETAQLLEDWTAWGFLRHPGYLRPAEVADTVLAVVATPRGTHVTLIEVQPEAPDNRPPSDAMAAVPDPDGSHLTLIEGGNDPDHVEVGPPDRDDEPEEADA